MTRHVVAWTIALALCDRVAHAEVPSTCDVLLDTARNHHAAARWREALEASRAAYECSHEPELLFAMGQMAFNLADYRAAEAFYTRFVDSKPDPDEAALALQALAVTRERIEAEARPRPVVLVDRPADKIAWAFALSGGALVLGGGGLYLSARLVAADTSGSYGDYARRSEQADRRRWIAVGCEAAGAAFAIVAAVRWLRRPDRETRSAMFVPIAEHGTVGFAITGAL